MAGTWFQDSVTCRQLVVEKTELTAGRTGRNAYFAAKTNVALGGWFNASKSYVDLDVSGGAAGLLSAHCMELKLPSTKQAAGHLTIAEHELVCAASTTVNDNISFSWFQVSGDATAKTDFNLKGSFFELTGMEVGTNNIFANETPTTANMTHSLRIRIDDVNYYIVLSTTAT